MSAMSQIMDATYCVGGDMDFGRMFDQYLHKGSECFDLSLSIPDSTQHNQHTYMADQGYGSYGSEEGYELTAMASMAQQEPDTTTHAQQPSMYPHQMTMQEVMGTNPQFPPQNLYIPPISQHGPMSAVNTSGYMVEQPGCGPPTPVYTSAGMAMHTVSMQAAHHQQQQQQQQQQRLMMQQGQGMMAYYPHQGAVPAVARASGSPNSGGSPSPGSEDSDDSIPLAQLGRGKRPSPDAAAETTTARGKKPKVTKKGKKKRDPNEPQKPVSAYALFFRDTQAAIKGQNPNASFGEVSKIVASMWDALDADNKSVYKKKTEAAKKEYLKALAAYRASLVSKGGEGEMFPGGQGGPAFAGQFTAPGGFCFPTSTAGNPQGQMTPGAAPNQVSPLAKKSPLLTSLMADPPAPLMTPPMSQPMPPSGPPMMPSHAASSMPPMSGQPPMHHPAPGQAPQQAPPPPPQGLHQAPQVPHGHMTPMASVPSTSPYMTQPNPAMTSPGAPIITSAAGSPGAVQQQQQGQQQANQGPATPSGQQPSQQANQQGQGQQQQGQGQQGQSQQGQGQQGSGGQQQGVGQPNMGQCPSSTPNCIRSGCTNPAINNPEWEDEYCSNECVVSHCRDVFNTWVAGNQSNAPTYPAPVK